MSVDNDQKHRQAIIKNNVKKLGPEHPASLGYTAAGPTLI